MDIETKLTSILASFEQTNINSSDKEILSGYVRIQRILNHLGQDNTTSSSLLSNREIIPQPGSYEYLNWQKALKNQANVPQSQAYFILKEWQTNFLKGNKILSSGLRRIRIIQNHLKPLDRTTDVIYVE